MSEQHKTHEKSSLHYLCKLDNIQLNYVLLVSKKKKSKEFFLLSEI